MGWGGRDENGKEKGNELDLHQESIWFSSKKQYPVGERGNCESMIQ